MEEMRKAAFTSVARGCGFALLGVFCVMVGFSYDIRLMFQTGGMLSMIAVLVLVFKGRRALTSDYKHTEMWLMLPEDFRPPEAYAKWAAATVLRDAYFTFAQYTAAISVVMWSMALFVRLVVPA
jgi:hypothetical protein